MRPSQQQFDPSIGFSGTLVLMESKTKAGLWGSLATSGPILPGLALWQLTESPRSRGLLASELQLWRGSLPMYVSLGGRDSEPHFTHDKMEPGRWRSVAKVGWESVSDPKPHLSVYQCTPKRKKKVICSYCQRDVRKLGA